MSEPFSIRVGTRNDITLVVAITPPKSAHRDNSLRLEAGGERRAVVNEAMIRRLTTLTQSIGATEVVLSNDPSFALGRRSFAISPADCAITERDDGLYDARCAFPWDPLDGIDDTGDGMYSVFAKFIDEDGYESAVERDGVALDRTPPTVLSSTLSPSAVRPGDLFFVPVSLSEPLADDPAAGSALVEGAPGACGSHIGASLALQLHAEYGGLRRGRAPARRARELAGRGGERAGQRAERRPGTKSGGPGPSSGA